MCLKKIVKTRENFRIHVQISGPNSNFRTFQDEFQNFRNFRNFRTTPRPELRCSLPRNEWENGGAIAEQHDDDNDACEDDTEHWEYNWRSATRASWTRVSCRLPHPTHYKTSIFMFHTRLNVDPPTTNTAPAVYVTAFWTRDVATSGILTPPFPKLCPQSDAQRRVASRWALPHISSSFL